MTNGVAALITSALPVGSNTIAADYQGHNSFAFSASTLAQTVNKASTSTTVGSSPNPSVSGQAVTFTATVSVASPGSAAVAHPTGTVTFYNNGTSIGTGILSVVSGQDQATFTTATLSTGTHSITAAYSSGDGSFNASPASTAISQAVNTANTSATVASSVNPSVYGQTVTFTATVSVVSAGSTAVAYPTGTVTFYDGGTSIGTATLSVVSGQDQATLGTSSLATGTDSVTAAYTSADGNFNASPVSAAISQVVNKDSTTSTAALRLPSLTLLRPLRLRRRSQPTHRARARQRAPSTSTTPRRAPT